jgi:nucleoside-diphosphate kinase
MERTLIIVKPHAAARGLTGEFLARFERMGLRIAAIRTLTGDRDLWERFYPSDEAWFRNVGGKTIDDAKARGLDLKPRLGTDDAPAIGRMVKGWLVDHMASGAAIAAVLEGNEARVKVRAACGATMPNRAAPGTIRFDYSSDGPALANDEKRPVYNLIHASDPEEKRGGKSASDYEIGVLFPELTNHA